MRVTDGSISESERLEGVVLTGERPLRMPTQPPRPRDAVIFLRDYAPSAAKGVWLYDVDDIPRDVGMTLRT